MCVGLCVCVCVFVFVCVCVCCTLCICVISQFFSPIGQGRLDGAICEFSETDKMAYLQRVKEAGVVNIEMECVALGALCHRVGVKCAVVCVTLVDRLLGDQVRRGGGGSKPSILFNFYV